MPTNRYRPSSRAHRQAKVVDDAALQDHGSNGQPLTKHQQRAVEGIRQVRRELTGGGPGAPTQGR